MDGGDAALGNRLSCFNGLVAVIPQDLPYLSPYPFCTIQPWPISTSLPMYACMYLCHRQTLPTMFGCMRSHPSLLLLLLPSSSRILLVVMASIAVVLVVVSVFFFFVVVVSSFSSSSFSFFLPTRLVKKVLTI